MREETRCHHMGYSFQLTARVILYAPSHREDSTHHSFCYTSRGALAGMKNNSMGLLHEGSIRRPIAPWANVHLQMKTLFFSMVHLLGESDDGAGIHFSLWSSRQTLQYHQIFHNALEGSFHTWATNETICIVLLQKRLRTQKQ